MSYNLPPVAALSSSPEHIRGVLDHLFEPCPALYTVVAADLLPNQFPSYDGFIEAVSDKLCALRDSGTDDGRLLEILAAHPRLGAPKPEALSEHSRSEQTTLAGGGEMAEKLKKLNEEYEAKFPGMRYVVFVNGRSREVIIQDMEQRIAAGDLAAEKTAAIEAMRDIAKDRAKKLQ